MFSSSSFSFRFDIEIFDSFAVDFSAGQRLFSNFLFLEHSVFLRSLLKNALFYDTVKYQMVVVFMYFIPSVLSHISLCMFRVEWHAIS